MKNKIIVIFSSHLGVDKNNEFINHINSTIGKTIHEVYAYENYNQYSLTEIYNKAITEHYNKNAIMVFCHNDLEIKTKDWGRTLLNHFNNSNYAILGVAGSTYIGAEGIWWSDFSKVYGIVEHTNGINTWTNEYSNSFKGIKPTVNIDGLFMAVDSDKIKHKFNEDYKGYHFYDLSFSVDNYLDNIEVGVITSIRILHKSVGKTNQQWEENRQKFVKEYQLPIRHVNDKLRVLICCQFFNNYTGSEVSNYELSKELVKLGCDVTVISQQVGNPLYDKAIKNGVKVYDYNNLPNYKLNEENKFTFIKNEAEFDIIHINHKPIGELILQLYPNTPAVMHVRSEVIPVFEEPIINPIIKRYISIRDSITEYIKKFGITEEKITLIDNPFDISRFNCNYKLTVNEKEIVLFIGTIDHLRINIVKDLIENTKLNNQLLWVIGSNTLNFDFSAFNNVKYLGIKSNVEDYIKTCNCTAGIFKGRTTIEGFLCGKKGWVYIVDKEGNIENKELKEVPKDIVKYDSRYSAKKVLELYETVIDEMWFNN